MNFFTFCEMDKKAAVPLDGRLVQRNIKIRMALS